MSDDRMTVSTEVDRVIHEPARLSIMTNLFIVDSANATFLLRQTGLTWGNLGSHLGKLEDAGYVAVVKGYKGRKPETTISLTPSGRTALLDYRERIIDALAPVAKPAPSDVRVAGDPP